MAGSEGRIDELLGVLDMSLLEFEELLGEMADQNEKLIPKVEAMAREQREIRTELADLREMIETLSQRLERLSSILSESTRAH
jgi:Mg2+ and Co2+ transporter CorA